jgi:hypothetical protein
MKDLLFAAFALLLSSAVFGQSSPSSLQPAVAPQIVEVPGGALRLKGYLWKPAGRDPFPAVLFNHGSGAEDARWAICAACRGQRCQGQNAAEPIASRGKP